MPLASITVRRCRAMCGSLVVCVLWLALAVPRVLSAEIWSLEPLERPAVPAVRNASWPSAHEKAASIDRFILARLEAKGLAPAASAGKQKLIRRLYFDLWGLPPTPEAVQAFVADDSPHAYECLVDALLADPHYGERQARYWLDVVRYADTNGYERDAEKQNAWKYRDWVIDSFNVDKSYDRFIVEQLAGDELPDADSQTRTATGFLRVGTFDDEPNDPLQYKFEQLDDLVHVTSTAFLAMTVRCARCHDHKFDPIPQRDYYAFLNFFIAGEPAKGELLAFTDSSRQPPPVRLLKGGDPRNEQEEVPPGFLSMVSWQPAIEPPPAESRTSQRRLQLARWIADARNPLTARVAANRLWQQHFGQALARTSDNFGNTGYAPTHPELLDWLAAELIEGDWRLKRLHRLILLSSTYQMDSAHAQYDACASQDPENELWWRANRRRLEAEALRDAMLAAGGQLDPRRGGPGFVPDISAEALEGLSMKGGAWHPSPPGEQSRRTIYMYTKRSLISPLITVFDFADTTQPCTQRTVSTVAPQALALLNNQFVHERSRQLAARLRRDQPDSLHKRIDRLWWLTLSRSPGDAELKAALSHLDLQRKNFAAQRDDSGMPRHDAAQAERLALESLCHVLLNTNEFIYVD